jgi:hypothetical protein
MKKIFRWYYLLFKKDRCYKATLTDRLKNKWDFVGCSDKYIGNGWWLRPKKPDINPMPEHTKIKKVNNNGSTTDMILIRFRMFED